MISADKTAGHREDYDDKGNKIRTTYVGRFREPVEMNRVARVEYIYNTLGNLIKEQYFDENGKRIPGYSRFGERCLLWTATYNFQGNMEPARGNCLQK